MRLRGADSAKARRAALPRSPGCASVSQIKRQTTEPDAAEARWCQRQPGIRNAYSAGSVSGHPGVMPMFRARLRPTPAAIPGFLGITQVSA
jgi:hypothetical protein